MKKKIIKLVRSSSYFDSEYYLRQNPDVAGAGFDPVKHYLEFGWLEGRNPSAKFDGNTYLKVNTDVAEAKVCPLVHFLKQGEKEGRSAFPVEIDEVHVSEVATFQQDVECLPVESEDERLVRSSSYFDSEYYLRQNPDVAGAGFDPVKHYLEFGWLEGRNPSAKFDGNAYLKTYSDIASANLNPLLHFLSAGEKEGRNPLGIICSVGLGDCTDRFDSELYLALNPDVAASGMNAKEHWQNDGRAEKRLGASMEEFVIGDFQDLDPLRKTCCVVAHDLSRTGCPINSWNMIVHLRKKFNVVVVSFGDGPLEGVFRRDSDVFLKFPLRARFSKKMCSVLLTRALPPSVQLEFSLVNSIESRNVLEYFARNKIPAILFIHEFPYHYDKDAFKTAFLDAGQVCFSTEIVKNAALNKLGVDVVLPILPQGKSDFPEKIKDWGEMLFFRNLAKQKRENNELFVLGCGSIEYRKGVDSFIRVAGALKRSFPERRIRFFWAGGGQKELFAKLLLHQVCVLGLEDCLTFTGSIRDMDEFYKLADVFLLTSNSDPLPGVCIEAMSHSVPVVCFEECSGFPEFFRKHALDEFCVAKYLDVSDFTMKAKRFLAEPDLKKMVGEKLRVLSKECFDMSAYIDSILRLKEDVTLKIKRECSDIKENESFMNKLRARRGKALGIISSECMAGEYSEFESLSPCFASYNKPFEISDKISAERVFELSGGNTGNVAFCSGLRVSLAEPPKEGDIFTKTVSKEGCICVIPSANQIGAHIDMGNQAERLRKLWCPVVAVGLGAQAGNMEEIPYVPQGTIKYLEAICERAVSDKPNISLSGNFTMSLMKRLGFEDNCTVLGCPSLFISEEKSLGKVVASNFRGGERIAVAVGNPHQVQLDYLECDLLRLAQKHGDGRFVVQNALEMMKIALGEFDNFTESEILRFQKHFNPDVPKEHICGWLKSRAKMFSDVSSWMNFYREYDFVVGPRIHGIMLALQAGVPALCIAIDSRIRELCEIMKVPYIDVESVKYGATREDLLRAFEKFDPEEFDKNRAFLAGKFVEFLSGNKLRVSEKLCKLAKVAI